jgi:hypothetical protein
MTRWTLVCAAAIVATGLTAFVRSQEKMDHQMAAKPPAAASAAAGEFERLKSLAGAWEGTFGNLKAETTFEVTANGSAVINVLKPGAPDAMVTVFHMDGATLMVTHYCAAGNQPRMVSHGGKDPNAIAFQFKDVTNLSSPTAGHMRALTLTMPDANHHSQAWTFRQDGKDATEVFAFTRKATPAGTQSAAPLAR